MGKKQTTTNTPAWTPPPPTVATTNLQTMVDTPVDYATPIRNAYGRAENQRNRSYNSPFGAATTAAVKGAAMREETDTMNQNRGLDLANAAQQSASDKFNRQATVAGLTAPQMYNAKSVTQTPFDWMGLAQMGVGIGTAALTGGASAAAGGGAASS